MPSTPTLVYKSLHGLAPGYRAALCISVAGDSYRRYLRSADKIELQVPRHKLLTYLTRSFSIAGPSARNSLPQHLRGDKLSHGQFLSELKTHLFCISYNCTAWKMRNPFLLTYNTIVNDSRRYFWSQVQRICNYVANYIFSNVCLRRYINYEIGSNVISCKHWK